MITFAFLGDVLRQLKPNWMCSLCASFCIPLELCTEFPFLAHFSNPYRFTLCEKCRFQSLGLIKMARAITMTIGV